MAPRGVKPKKTAAPPGTPADLTPFLFTLSSSFFRMHDTAWDPIHFGKGKCWRFDDPEGRFGVMYCGASYYGAFSETIGQEIPPPESIPGGFLDQDVIITEDQLSAYRLSRLVSKKPLRLVDLTGPFLKHFRASAQHTVGLDYRDSQQLSRKIYDHPDKVDGIYYLARNDPHEGSFALFQRCRKTIIIEKRLGSLLEPANRHTLARIVNHYQLTIIPASPP